MDCKRPVPPIYPVRLAVLALIKLREISDPETDAPWEPPPYPADLRQYYVRRPIGLRYDPKQGKDE